MADAEARCAAARRHRGGRHNRVLILGVIIGAGAIARRNIVRRRGDHRRAFRVVVIVAVGVFGTWLFGQDHPRGFGSAWEDFVLAGGKALFRAAVVWIAYMAAEPYVRRHWPRLVTSWYRFFDGRFRDPLVGRHVLFGVAGGAALHLIDRSINGPALLRGEPPRFTTAVEHYEHFTDGIALLFYFPERAIWNAMGSLIVLLLLRALVRNRIAAALLWLAAITGLNLTAGAPLALEITTTLLFAVGLLTILLRLGLFGLCVALITHYTCGYLGPSFHFGAWSAWPNALGWMLLAALAGYGFFVALAGHPLFGRALLEE